MSKQYFVEVEYTVTESISVEADSPEAAEKKALELLRLGATQRNIVGDTSEEAEVIDVNEAEEDR